MQEKQVIQSTENIKKVKENAELEVRNLAAWNVPLEEAMSEEDPSKSKKKPPLCPRPQSASPKPLMAPSKTESNPQAPASKRRCLSGQCNKNRVRSASAGRSPQDELRARCWSFLFENLHRAVDEIYQMCEKDESIVESKEAILVLENYTREFRALVEWLTLNKDFENTPPPNRPTSLAWEVRKSRPVKAFLINAFVDKLLSPAGKEMLKCESLSANSDIKVNIDEKKNLTEMILSVETTQVVVTETTEPIQPVSICNSAVKTDCTLEPTVPSLIPNVASVKLENGVHESLPEDALAKVNPKIEISLVEPSVKDENSIDKVSKDSNEHLQCSLSNGESSEVAIVRECEPESTEKSKNMQLSEENSKKIISNPELSSTENSENLRSEIENTSVMVSVEESHNVLCSAVEHKDSTHGDSKLPSLPAISSSQSVPVKGSYNEIVEQPIAANVTNLLQVSQTNEQISKQKLAVKKVNASTLTCFPEKPVTVPKQKVERAQQTDPDLDDNVSVQDAANLNLDKPLIGDQSASSLNADKMPNQMENTTTKQVDKTSGTVEINNSTGSSTPPLKASAKTGNATGSALLVRNSSRNIIAPTSKLPTGIASAASTTNIKKASSRTCLSSTQPGRNAVVGGMGRGTPNPFPAAPSSLAKKPVRSATAATTKFSSQTTAASSMGKSQMTKNDKGGSTSSISSTSSAMSWADRVKSTTSLASITSVKSTSSKDRLSTKSSVASLKDEPSIPRRKPGDEKSKGTRSVGQTSGMTKTASVAKEERYGYNSVKAPYVNSTKSAVRRADVQPKYRTPITSNKLAKNKPVPALQKESQKMINSASQISSNQHSGKKLKESDCRLKNNFVNQGTSNLEGTGNANKEDQKLINRDMSPTRKPHNVQTSVQHESSEIKVEDKDLIKSSNDSSGSDKAADEDDSDGWEVVRGRTRSRYSPAKKLSGPSIHNSAITYSQNTSEIDTDWQEQQNDLSSLPWGDRMELELRTPGRALQMHEKLSSPFRKWSPSEAIRRHEEKQAKAQEQRERLLEEKAQKFKDIAKKVEEMRAWKEEQQQQLRITMEKKLQRAEEKRKMQLQKIVRKAHDEEEKVNEIAFINSLEAQNKRHDILSKEKDHEARLLDLQEERQRRQEEKAAKEAAAEERRKILEAERQARLLEMQERRKLKDMKIEQQLQEKEKERQELANQKARDRELRLSALNAAQQANLEELQKKIQQKQEESARRHEENMEQIRQKAFELSVRRYSSNNDEAPRLIPYETKKMCTLCNVLIGSEVYLLSHLRGKKHQEAVKEQHQGQDPSTEELESYNLKHIIDAPADKLVPEIAFDKERQKALKKRCKKLRQRMNTRGSAFENDFANQSKNTKSQHRQRLMKCIKEINTYLADEKISGPWPSNLVHSLDRVLGDLERILEPHGTLDQVAFGLLGGIASLNEILKVILKGTKEINTVIPNRSLSHTGDVYSVVLSGCFENCLYVLNSNKIGNLLEFLIHRLNILMQENNSASANSIMVALPTDLVAGSIMKVLAITATCLAENGSYCENNNNANQINGGMESFNQKIQDVISYTVSIGIVDKLSLYFHNVRGPIDSEPEVAIFLLNSLNFLTALTKLMTSRCSKIFEPKKGDDNTQLIATFRVTELVGIVSLLYGMLLHSGAPSRGLSAPPELPEHTVEVTFVSLRMLNHLAVVDLQMLQSVLGNEGLSLQLRHIASYLLWYCTHWTTQDLLHEVILLMGYFTVLNPDNQMVIQAGQRPTVLQQLCMLPFEYFSDPHLSDILFPTLLACCYGNSDNKIILEQEMSAVMLSKYIEVALLDSQEKALMQNGQAKEIDDEKARWSLAVRFPKNRWISAKLFFSDEA